jgi:hypothetical protein
LSGFIEAEGCFRFRNNKATSEPPVPFLTDPCQDRFKKFYISQNSDLYILNAIKIYFLSNHKIGIHKDPRYDAIHYRISISGKPCIARIKEHLNIYPAEWCRIPFVVGDKLPNYGDLFYIESDKDNRVAKSTRCLPLSIVSETVVIKDGLTAVKVQRVYGS